MAQDSDFETVIRRSWWYLIESRLPEAADGRGWSVATPSGFERVLLDHVLDAPWEEVVEPPSPRNAPVLDLVLAIEIAERAIAGEVDLGSLNRRSLARRAERASEAEIAAMIAEHGIIDGAEAEALATEAGLSAADLVARIRESGMAARAVRRGPRRDPLED